MPRKKQGQTSNELWVLRWDTGADIWYVGKTGRDTRSIKAARKWTAEARANEEAESRGGRYEVWTLGDVKMVENYT